MSGVDRGVVLAEYGTRFEADVASACLADHGIESLVRADPAHTVAPHLVTMPGFRLVVHTDEVDEARAVLGLDQPRDLEAEALDRSYFHIAFSERPRWVRWFGVTAIVAVVGPIAVLTLVLCVMLLLRAAPG